MIATIFYRNSFDGGDGWAYYPMTVEIADTCPVCGDQRGTPQPAVVIEDGEYFAVDGWTNPCGHLDTYRQCWEEARALLCSHDRLNEDGFCRSCGTDCRGIG